MKLKAFEAHYSCGHFKPNNIKNGSVVKKLSWKNLGVSIKLFYTVYDTFSSWSNCSFQLSLELLFILSVLNCVSELNAHPEVFVE